ncbi:MAG: histidine phosphatase family protein [Erysipelotrichia bacterium]|nr:histidine phosphatase family protein [Erysipelotrichia bacterium]
MNIYIMRHGQTDWNINHKVQGLTDIPLNSTGIAQAQEAFEKLKNIHFDYVYCSPLTRTKQTAALVTGNKYPIIVDPLLIERDFGDLEGVDFWVYDMSDFWDRPLDKSFNNEETVMHMLYRAQKFVDKLPKAENILIVTHGAFYRALRAVLTDVDVTKVNLYDFKLNNCEFFKVERNS